MRAGQLTAISIPGLVNFLSWSNIMLLYIIVTEIMPWVQICTWLYTILGNLGYLGEFPPKPRSQGILFPIWYEDVTKKCWRQQLFNDVTLFHTSLCIIVPSYMLNCVNGSKIMKGSTMSPHPHQAYIVFKRPGWIGLIFDRMWRPWWHYITGLHIKGHSFHTTKPIFYLYIFYLIYFISLKV